MNDYIHTDLNPNRKKYIDRKINQKRGTAASSETQFFQSLDSHGIHIEKTTRKADWIFHVDYIVDYNQFNNLIKLPNEIILRKKDVNKNGHILPKEMLYVDVKAAREPFKGKHKGKPYIALEWIKNYYNYKGKFNGWTYGSYSHIFAFQLAEDYGKQWESAFYLVEKSKLIKLADDIYNHNKKNGLRMVQDSLNKYYIENSDQPYWSFIVQENDRGNSYYTAVTIDEIKDISFSTLYHKEDNRSKKQKTIANTFF